MKTMIRNGVKHLNHSSLYYKILFVVGLGLFTDGYFLYISSCTEPLIKLSLNLTSLQVGLLQSIAPIGAVLGAIISGPLIDKYGRKPLLAVDLSIFFIVSILLFFVASFPEILFGRFIIGIGVGISYPIYAAYLVESTPNKEHSAIVAISMFGNVLAMPIVALAGYIFYSYFATNAWHYIFLSGVIPSILCFISRNKLPESIAWDKTEKSKVKENFFQKYAHLFTSEYRLQTIVLAGCWFIMDISYYGIGLFTTSIIYTFHSHQSHLVNQFLANLRDTVIITSFAALGAFLGIWAVKHYSLKQLQKYGFYLSGIGLCLLSLYGNVFVSDIYLITMFSLYNISINIGPDITTYLLPSESYPSEFRATGHAFSTSMGKVGAILGSLGLPILQDLFGVNSVLILLGLSLFAGAYITKFVKEKI